ncbi:MAG: cadherin repeat domain-containing protein, partial [SAR86 cluster bacterium]|nr:cadherin repeat domain-containing protein [SAR86 cluster bacterium]
STNNSSSLASSDSSNTSNLASSGSANTSASGSSASEDSSNSSIQASEIKLNRAPVILNTLSSSMDFSENQKDLLSVFTEDDDGDEISISITGPDADIFELVKVENIIDISLSSIEVKDGSFSSSISETGSKGSTNYTIGGTDSELFEILSSNSGEILSLKSDSEIKSTYSVFLTATDEQGNSSTKYFTITGKNTREVDSSSLNSTSSSRAYLSSTGNITDDSLVCDSSFTSGLDGFRYCWEEDQTTSGTEYSATPISPLEVEFLNETVSVVDSSFAERLYIDYGIILSDEGERIWTQDMSFAVYETMQQIPQFVRNENFNSENRTLSKWTLTDSNLVDDISIEDNGEVKNVNISSITFENANPRIALIEGKRGTYFSNRLHHAIIRFVTNNGNDSVAVSKILFEKYGIKTEIPDYLELTGEVEQRFQPFHPSELVEIISMFEEMPRGMHKIVGLNYLVRRLDGTRNDYMPEAPAIAWVDSGYIEFMELGFNSDSLDYVHRLILHEKAHFLWGLVFDETLKDDWIELGGWYEDSSKVEGWSTTKTTEFVSAYAHLKNPNEDMAESISFFIINPDKLRSRSNSKYEFIRDRIMQGNVYISKIREDLTFEVYNLYPDYVYPGKIRRINVSVIGQPTDEKLVTVELELHALDGVLEGAQWARMRIFSTEDTYFDLYMYPKNGNSTGTVLSGSYTLPANAANGYWQTSQIVLQDQVGNQRMESTNDFGWRMYVDSPGEDLIPPEYIANSAALSLDTKIIEDKITDVIIATWDFSENSNNRDDFTCYGALNDELISTYSLELYGEARNNQCYLEYWMPNYMPSGIYRLNYTRMLDQAGNETRTYLTAPEESRGSLVSKENNGSADEAAPQIYLETTNPDTSPPQLDLNIISISAESTNPSSPNGETEVKFTFRIKDDISGYKLGYFTFRDPQGLTKGYYHYPPRRSDLYPNNIDLDWYEYTATVMLPAGSAPGTWGVTEFTLRDRALNFKTYDFTETITFITE